MDRSPDINIDHFEGPREIGLRKGAIRAETTVVNEQDLPRGPVEPPQNLARRMLHFGAATQIARYVVQAFSRRKICRRATRQVANPQLWIQL